MNKQVLILFSKWPSHGFSKTRIQEVIGEDTTKDFCFACLDDLIFKMQNLRNTDTIIVSDTYEDSISFYNKYGVKSISLEEMNIGKEEIKSNKFHKIFKHFLGFYQKAVLIPMDVPHINPKVITSSFDRLDYFNHVFGPETNGGVYLIGIKKLLDNTFDKVRWGTENSCMDLIKNSNNYLLLEFFFDLNNISDLNKLTPTTLNTCPSLTNFIKSIILQKIAITREVITT